MLLALACSAPALLSCSLPLPQAASAMRIEPLLRIRNSDSSAGGFYQLGRYYQGQQRYAQAAEAYRSALRQDPGHLDAQSALGAVYALQGQFDAALAEFRLILETAPQRTSILNNLGYTHYLEGNLAAAIKAFEQVIALEPQNRRALNNLALAHQKMGDAEQARQAFSRAAQSPGASGTAIVLATAASVSLPPWSATSVALESSAPAVSLAVMPAAAAHESNLALAPLDHAGVLKLDRSLGQLHAPAAPAAADSRSPQGAAFRFEIANGNGVSDFARKTGDKLARNGLPQPQLSNLNAYRQHRTLIQYRAGFHHEALRLSQLLQTPPVLLSASALHKNADVRLILGSDVASKGVLLRSDQAAVHLAGSGREAKKIAGVGLRLARRLGDDATQFL